MTPISPPAQALPDWPYPYWIAHRGAGRLAPENTLAAIRSGASHGFRMFECDARLSADGVPYLMHDDTLERTTGASGSAADWDWSRLSQLDAGSWLASPYAGEPLASLANVLRWCIANHVLINIEIKPFSGTEAQTGRVVAELVASMWPAGMAPPLLSSFETAALAGARDAVPGQTRALLLEHWDEQAPAQAEALGCRAIVADWQLWSGQRVRQCHAAALRALCYTVNEAQAASELGAMGVDGIITDRLDLFGSAALSEASVDRV